MPIECPSWKDFTVEQWNEFSADQWFCFTSDLVIENSSSSSESGENSSSSSISDNEGTLRTYVNINSGYYTNNIITKSGQVKEYIKRINTGTK